MAHAFDALVIEVDMGNLDFRWQRFALHREPVIVRSDLDVAIAKILYWLVATAMTKDEFESLTAKRATEELMAKADTKRRHT